MAKAGDKPKSFKIREEQQKLEDTKAWVDPNPDPYGFEKAINYLDKNGYSACKENGILYVKLTKDSNLKEDYDKIVSLIKSIGFKGSFGAGKPITKKQAITFVKEED